APAHQQRGSRPRQQPAMAARPRAHPRRVAAADRQRTRHDGPRQGHHQAHRRRPREPAGKGDRGPLVHRADRRRSQPERLGEDAPHRFHLAVTAPQRSSPDPARPWQATTPGSREDDRMSLTGRPFQWLTITIAVLTTAAVLIVWNKVHGPRALRLASRAGLLTACYLTTAVAVLVSI